jgi:3-hydroxymyristoyl/3-hydroxydecanoyl-(acyl carrier protein) dehydratase
MKKEIKACMAGVSTDGDAFSAEFVFPASFKGFKGHFPDNPILPGVCLVQTALVLAEESTRRSYRLQGIRNAKFMASVAPGQAVQVEGSLQDGTLRASISSGETRIATLKLQVADA